MPMKTGDARGDPKEAASAPRDPERCDALDTFIFALLAMIIAFASFAWALYRIFLPHRWVKYVPSAVALLVAAGQLYAVRTGTGWVAELGRVLVAILFLAGSVAGIVAAALLDRLERLRDAREEAEGHRDA